MKTNIRLITGAACIVILSAGIGFTCNALRADGLPLIRKPLRETRAYATKEQMASSTPISVRSTKPIKEPESKAPEIPLDNPKDITADTESDKPNPTVSKPAEEMPKKIVNNTPVAASNEPTPTLPVRAGTFG